MRANRQFTHVNHMALGPIRLLTHLFCLVILLSGCAEPDPFDPEQIERDLEKRTVRNLYDELEGVTYAPPDDGALTESQIEVFLRFCALTQKIREVAGHRLEDQMDKAAVDHDRYSRMATAFAAMGSARAFATAELRAAVNLGVNPFEQEWVRLQAIDAVRAFEQQDVLDERVTMTRRALDREIDFELADRKRVIYEEALARKREWIGQQEESRIANMQLVEAQLADLAPCVPEVARFKQRRSAR